MKTKYLFGAAAALMMAACSQDELVSVKQDGIAYSVTASKQTRAADSYCNNALPESFKVWARTTDGNLYINGDVIKNEGGVWTDQAGTRYWPENKALDFYAQVNGDNEFNFNNGAPTFDNFTVKDNVTEQLDLIYSVNKNVTKPGDGKVVLNFRHALSQVCFRAKNNMKTMQVEIKGVSVGHLTNAGTFAFPAESTDKNYVHPSHGDEVDPNAPELNGGVWTIPADAAYNKKYDVTPIDGTVVLPAQCGVKNLTCPEDNHQNGFAQVLTLLPQEVKAWDPTVKGSDYNGAYFLVKVVLSNVVKDDSGAEVATVVYDGLAAVPVNVKWEQGYRYIYTFVFDEGGDGGWTPDPNDPKPVLTNIKYDITVDDFIPVEKDGTKMDTGKDDEKPAETTTYTLVYNANGGVFGTSETRTATGKSTEDTYSFTVDGTFLPARDGYTFLGWAETSDATTATIKAGDEVTLEKAAPSKTIYAVWEKVEVIVDHSKNPLLKWAETDLVYNKTTKTSGFASSYTDQASLYQWGRNPGWKDYIDALGGTTTDNGGRVHYEYATYNKHYNVGTGLHGGADDISDYYYDNKNDSFDELLYFMNPQGTDYWIGTGGGSTWNERAEACGFTTSVCPENWRIPTKADFLEIKPSEALKGNGNLASVANRMELRTIDGICTYAIRWSAETQNSKTYLRIDAIVVPDNYTNDDLTSIDWTDKNVVTRYFGANGFIHGFYHVNVVSNGQTFPVARPMPGTETHADNLRQNTSYWTVTWDYITDYSVNNEGYYWMSDEKTAFTFQDNTRVKVAPGTDNSYPFKDRQSALGILPVNAQDCCAIRCVKAE